MTKYRSTGDRIFDLLNITLILGLCATIVYPFLNQLTLSVSTPTDVARPGLHLIPDFRNLNFDSYRRVLSGPLLQQAAGWTILRTVLGTVTSVTITIMMAYPLSKRNLPLRNFWTFYVVFTMFFSGGLIPTFLLVRSLGLLNTLWALILPPAATAFSLLIARNFMMSISEELAESAKIDGANDIVILFRIYVPISMPIIATLALWSMVAHWNAWFDAMIYIQRPPIRILQIILRRTIMEAQHMALASIEQQAEAMDRQEFTPESIRAAILMVVTMPIVCSYPFFQRYFVKGIMVGSLKG